MRKLAKLALAGIIGIAASIAVNNSFAIGNPEACPEISQLKAGGIDSAELNDDGTYVAGQLGYYNTNDNWVFVVANIHANNDTDAVTKATKALSSLTGNPKPLSIGNGLWICRYNNPFGYLTAAVTPIEVNAKLKAIKVN